MFEVVGSADPVGISQRNAVGKAGVRGGVNRRAVLDAEEIGAVRIIYLEIRARFAVKVVKNTFELSPEMTANVPFSGSSSSLFSTSICSSVVPA